MALSLADADAMIAACRRNGVQLGVCLQRRAEPLFRRVHDAIHGGDLGEITLGVVTMPSISAMNPTTRRPSGAARGPSTAAAC